VALFRGAGADLAVVLVLGQTKGAEWVGTWGGGTQKRTTASSCAPWKAGK
jgi:hypothetical protein